MRDIDKYANYSIRAGISQRTVDTYVGHIRRLYAYLDCNGHVTCSAGGKCLITPEMLDGFNQWQYNKALKAETRNNYLAAFHSYFSYLAKLERIDRDPTPILTYVATGYDPMRDGVIPYEDDALILLMRAIADQSDFLAVRNKAFVLLALASAMRVSEICSLSINSLSEIQEGHTAVSIKGGRTEEISIAPFAARPIQDYVALRPKATRTEALFVTQKNTPLTRKQAHDSISTAQKRAGIATGIHIFRHTTLSRVNRFGDAMSRDIACHSIRNVTGRYTHTSREQRRQAIESVYRDFLEKIDL